MRSTTLKSYPLRAAHQFWFGRLNVRRNLIEGILSDWRQRWVFFLGSCESAREEIGDPPIDLLPVTNDLLLVTVSIGGKYRIQQPCGTNVRSCPIADKRWCGRIVRFAPEADIALYSITSSAQARRIQ
jgi:hypothetical protein